MRKMMFFGLVLAAAFLVSVPSVLSQNDGWVDLFDGKSLDGWVVRGGFATYKVEDGMIVGATADGSPNTFLTIGPYSDFELELDVLCDLELNSGVQVRSHVYEKDTTVTIDGKKRAKKAGTVHGYQVEITTQDKGTAGGIYDEARRGWLDDLKDKPQAHKAFKDGEWNRYKIRAVGNRVQTWVNGVPCADLTDDLDKSGFIGLQVHSVKSGSKHQVRWKNIRIRKL